MNGVITINLQGPRFVTCAGCGHEIEDERRAVSIDDCGEPTTRTTGIARATCKAFHDLLYGYRTSLAGCPALDGTGYTSGR